jgi:signal transduction histidine kinase
MAQDMKRSPGLAISRAESAAEARQTRVLVVEDESIVGLDIQHRLLMMGYAVTGLALNGLEALDLAAKTRPDIVLMDIRLKGSMSGIEAAEQILTYDIPVVYLTAYTDQATIERAKISKPFGYVIKPFEDRELNITVEIALYRHRVERQLRENEAQLLIQQDELEARVADRTAELTRVNEQLRLEIVARERAQAERAAVQEDRRRLAQDIHDSVTQSIFSLLFTTKAARAAAQHGAAVPLDETLEEVEAIAKQALKDLRLLLYQLRSPLLDQGGLTSALRYRLEAVEMRAGVNAVLVAPPELSLSPAAEEGVYRVAMEALNNALKYARASEVEVQLKCEADELVLSVTDNGIGFDQGTIARSAGLGLAGIQERAARLGGEAFVRSERDKGTTVYFRVNRFAMDSQDPEFESRP